MGSEPMRLTIGVSLAVLLSSCADTRPDATPPEPSPPASVYGQAPAARGGIPSVITLESLGSVTPAQDNEPSEVIMDQLAVTFSPAHLLVRVGTTVNFQNSETIAHNVHVSSMVGDSTMFDEDTLLGQNVSFVFDEEGGYDVTCSIHPGMTAFIFVTAAPYAVLADQRGAFELSDVPTGEYTLRIWSVEPGARSEQAIVKVDGEGAEVALR